MDCNANTVLKVKIEYYPTIIFYPYGAKHRKYTKKREPEEFLKFLQKYSSDKVNWESFNFEEIK